MELNDDLRLVAAIQDGLPLTARPYAAVGERLGMSEGEVIERIRRLRDSGVFKRFGVVVRHHECGYGANAMIVWDVAPDAINETGGRLARFPFVSLCYARPRHAEWPYNLYCMIHGRDRAEVLAHLAQLIDAAGVGHIPHAVLFSRRRFKQRGARYVTAEMAASAGAIAHAVGEA